MLTEQRHAGCGTQTAALFCGSWAAAALFTCWFIATMGLWGLIAFLPALALIATVALVPGLLLYWLAVQMRLANGWTATIAGLVAGEAVLFFGCGELPTMAPFPVDTLLFGAAGMVGGFVFWRNVRRETNAPDEPVSPPVPS
ncbi:hypothetical protein PIB19_06085 [Sphingomonas sp. 7/4-4]|uniref:hypothetical protein n=1 Tax=Sphingomonas sp. 7/4-4 TaxID=3018446 RepID=UPI0022F38ED7|nr:hypothetical protein [Sphingomonas sp. 7/4-4]WBY08964.1 hypothetical protein PIB19_06085 [Sphingomonas sp. 7/4-4]